jgi:hypothetical protein
MAAGSERDILARNRRLTLEVHLQAVLDRMPRKQVGRIDCLLGLWNAIDKCAIKARQARGHGDILQTISAV